MKTNWLDRRIASPGPALCLCLSEAEFYAAMEHIQVRPMHRWVGDEQGAATHRCVSDNGFRTCIVCLGDTTDYDSIQIASILVHEAVHVWQFYCEGIGEENPGDEQEAYGIQSISQELMTEYARRIK